MRKLSHAPRPHGTRLERRGGVRTPPREGITRGTTILCRTIIFRLRFQLGSCRITPHHAQRIDAMRKERSVDLKSKATKASSGRGSGMLRSVSPRRSAQEDGRWRDAFHPGTFGHKAFS